MWIFLLHLRSMMMRRSKYGNHRLPKFIVLMLRWFETKESDVFRFSLMLPYPFRSSIVIPRQPWPRIRYPEGWRHWHRLRFRSCLAELLIKWSYSTCTCCKHRFSFRDLLGKGKPLIRHMSGSICHKEQCPELSDKGIEE